MTKNELVKIMKEESPRLIRVPFKGSEIQVKPYLTVEERLAFVKAVTNASIKNPDYAYGAFGYVFKSAILQFYTDIDFDEVDTAEGNHIMEKLIFFTDIIDVVCAHTKDNIRELHDHCLSSLNAEMAAIKNPLYEIVEYLDVLMQNMQSSMSGINIGELKTIAESLSSLDENKIAKAFHGLKTGD